MSRVIEADVVKKFLFDKFKMPFDEEVDALPSADVKLEKFGEWKRKMTYQPRKNGKVNTSIYYVCSNCLSAYDRALGRCPVCDAIMKKGGAE